MSKFELLYVQEAWNKDFQRLHVWIYTMGEHKLRRYSQHVATKPLHKCHICQKIIEFDNLPEA